MLFETSRLKIQHLVHDDLDMLFEINNDKKCIQFNSWTEMSLEKCLEQLYKWTFEYQTSRAYGVFSAVKKDTLEPIGMCFIKLTGPDVYEIGFRFRTSQWGNGYAKEVTEGFSEYAKNTLKAKKIFAETFRENMLSRNVFEKLNFEKKEHPSGPDGILYERHFK